MLPNAHQQGITALLNTRAQMLQQPITQAEVDAYRATLRKVIAKQKEKTSLPEPFGDVLQTVSDDFFADKPTRTPAENAHRAEANLAKITPAQVNARIQQWLNASDKLVQMQAPSLTPIKLPSNDSIAAAAQQAERTLQPKLLAAKAQGKGAFTDQPKVHKIQSEQSQPLSGSLKSQITYWTLPNGDKVVLLQNPVAQDKIYWQAIGGAGFMQPEQNPWQTQLASQIIWQSAPQGWTSEQLGAWKTQHKISLNQSTEAQQSKVTGSAPQSEAQNLFHLYHAYYATPQISEDYRDSIASMARQIAMNNQSSRSIKENATVKLRFGKPAYEMPSASELDDTEEPQLFAQWQKLNRAPVTHYILTSQSPAQIKPLVERYLTDQPRQAVAPAARANRWRAAKSAAKP